VTRDRATGIELRLLPAGEFLMGTLGGEHGREPQETPPLVRLTRAFYLGPDDRGFSLGFRVARTGG
jgi:hypothetical protein